MRTEPSVGVVVASQPQLITLKAVLATILTIVHGHVAHRFLLRQLDREPLLALGPWIALVFEPGLLHINPIGITLIACLLLRIIMFTNKVHSMQTGRTDPWRSSCWLLLTACWVSVAGAWAMMAMFHENLPSMYVDAAPATSKCDFIQPLPSLPKGDCVGISVYAILIAVHSLVWQFISAAVL